MDIRRRKLRDIRYWGLGGLRVRNLAFRIYRGFWAEHLDARSAQFAYYAMLMVAPLLILIIGALAQIPSENVLDTFQASADRTLPHSAYEVIRNQINDIRDHSSVGLMVLATVVLGFAGSEFFLTISRGLNASYGVSEERSVIKLYGMALLLCLGAFVTLLTALVLLVLGPTLGGWLEEKGHHLANVVFDRTLRMTVITGVILFSTSIIYWITPNLRQRWKLFTPGNVFTTVGWVAISLGFRFYVENFARYNETYGAIGGVIVLMVWLYFVGMTFMMGGLINGTIYRSELARREERRAARRAEPASEPTSEVQPAPANDIPTDENGGQATSDHDHPSEAPASAEHEEGERATPTSSHDGDPGNGNGRHTVAAATAPTALPETQQTAGREN